MNMKFQRQQNTCLFIILYFESFFLSQTFLQKARNILNQSLENIISIQILYLLTNFYYNNSMGKKKQHHQKRQKGSDQDQTHEQQPKQQQPNQKQIPKQEQGKFEPIPPKKVSYCPVCSLTFELCKYGKQAPECAAFLFKLAPTKVTKYHPDFKPQQIQVTEKAAKEQKGEDEKPEKGEKDSKLKSLKEKYIVIEVKNRGKKNFITTVSGLNNFNVDAKEVGKKCSKKFAVSCSAIEVGTVQMQGDNFENMREFLLAQYKQLKKKYIIDKQQFSQKQAEQTAKKKEAKKRQQGAIKQVPEEQEKVEQQPNKNQLRLQLMKKAEEECNDDDD